MNHDDDKAAQVGELMAAAIERIERDRAAADLDEADRAPAVPGSDLPPYVEAPEVVPVRVVIRGRGRAGEVLGWRGDRVYVRYRTEAGNHLGWAPAGDVERT